MAEYAHDSSFLSRRAIAFVAIIGIHVLLIWGFSSGLATKVLDVIAPPIQTDIVQEVQKRDEPPPPPPPKMERPPVEVPPPDVSINLPAEPTTTAITDVTNKPLPVAPPPPAPVVRIAPKLDQKRSPSTDDYYPPTSRRMGEQGSTVIAVCVAVDGHPGEPKVQKGSGSPRLDEAAVKYAQHARYTVGTENGKPTEGCTAFSVKFVLTD